MAIKEAKKTSKKEPIIAFKTPPPTSPGGFGSEVKNSIFKEEIPFLKITEKIKIRGIIEQTVKKTTKNLNNLSLNIFIGNMLSLSYY